MWGSRSWEKILQLIHIALGSLLYVHENGECIQMLEGKQEKFLLSCKSNCIILIYFKCRICINY